MADKLDWLNKHYVLMSHNLVEDVVVKENYKIPFEFKEIFASYPGAEDFCKNLAKLRKFKEASQFLAFNLHHRALAWWGYCCVLSLRKELEEVPAPDFDLDNLCKPKKMEIPEWAKMPPLDAKGLDESKLNEIYAKHAELIKKAEEIKSKIPKEIIDRYRQVESIVVGEFRKQLGKDPMELFKEACEKLKKAKPDDVPFADPNSPIFMARDELRVKLEKIRTDTLKTIKAAVPMKNKEELQLQRGNALDSSYAYIINPSDKNALECMNLGNICPDTPEGLLSLVCFWSFGNMSPNSKMVIKTPPGLAANGLDKLMLMCALAKGGTRTFEERIEQYFLIGQEVVTAQNLWAEPAAILSENLREDNSLKFSGVASKEDEVEGSRTREDNKKSETELKNQFHRFKFEDYEKKTDE